MAQCPECAHDVGDDFGLITCANCGASLFIDMEGNAVSGQQQAEAVPSESQGEAYTENESPQEYQEFESPAEYEEPAPEAGFESNHESLESFESEPSASQENQLPEASVVGDLNFEAGEPEPESESADAPNFYSPEPTSANFNDVMDFANSDMSQASDGLLKYHLIISGIDTLDLRNEVKEALTDKRFIWDTEAMVRGIQDGVLEVDQVSAVKAYILISRIAHLPLQISWVQQPLNQP